MLQSRAVDAVTPLPSPNPWVSIWLSPRKTIRSIVDAEAEHRSDWRPVVAFAMVVQGIASLQTAGGTISVSMSVMPVILGMLQVLGGVLIGPFLLAFVGGWLGGDADPSDIRPAVAWSYVPYVVGAIVWAPLIFVYPTPPAGSEATVPLGLAALAFLALMVSGLWSFVTQVITLAEVQRFSILRALACLLILAVPLVVLGML